MGQTRTQTNSDWKGLADAEADRNAVFAALLARARPHRSGADLRGPQGLFPAGGDAGRGRSSSAFGGHGANSRSTECGVKPYPAVVYSQTAIVAGIALAKEIGVVDRIAALEIATTRRGYEQAGRDPEKWTPQNRDTADHSLPYIAARAMFDGDITHHSYAPAKLRDPQILAFMQKITVKPDPAFAK